jgi:chemotaxis protein methyltransferase CheR
MKNEDKTNGHRIKEPAGHLKRIPELEIHESDHRQEEKLLRQGLADLPNVPSDDIRKLIDELKMHQIRLEMQKEELRKAHDGLERRVAERTSELIQANAQLKRQIEKRRRVEKKLRKAFLEIKRLKDRLLAECTYLREEIKFEHNFEEIISQSDALKHVLFKVKQIAATDTTVLILGETGTGKELVARAVHNWSSRKNRPLVKVSCATLPANLIESELFGHEKGAFTNARNRQVGRFELAADATLFLDEIGELPLELQSRLLRVLQDGEFERLGSPRTLKVDVRIIAATNRNLEEEVRNGQFRKDLWYRLNVFPITVPPLRDRTEDIPLLVGFFVQKFGKKLGKQIKTTPSSLMNTLQKYPWSGNVRELENVIERAVINTQGPELRLAENLATFQAEDPAESQKVGLEEVERDYIVRILEERHWKIEGIDGAAKVLNLNPSTLRGRIRKFGIRRP